MGRETVIEESMESFAVCRPRYKWQSSAAVQVLAAQMT